VVTSIATSEAKHFAADEIKLSAGSPRSARAAAVYTINRAASTFIAMSASMNCTPWKSLTGLRNCLRSLVYAIAAQALGIAQGALDYAVGYVKERRQFGRAVADFQGVQFMLADMAMNLAAARQLTYAAAAKSELAMAGEKVEDLTFFSSAAKCLASDVAMSVTTDAVQLLGGYGYVSDYPVERMMRDAKITQIYEGTNQIQRMVMARQLLKG